jgi:hypothetical protein
MRLEKRGKRRSKRLRANSIARSPAFDRLNALAFARGSDLP